MTFQDFFQYIFPPVCVAVGFLIQRILRKDSLSESLARTQQVLNINKELRDQNLSVSEIQDLQEKLTKRREAFVRASETRKQLKPRPNEGDTQYELNVIAGANFQKADAELRIALVTLEGMLGPERALTLDASQKHWERFRDAQAEMVSSRYKGGSIMSLIRGQELELLTLERIEQLRRIVAGEKVEG